MVREKILASWEARQSPPRPHLGASQIGNDCNRALWYSFRWAVWPHFDGRTLRLFDRGQREEAVFVEELRRIGARASSFPLPTLVVTSQDPLTVSSPSLPTRHWALSTTSGCCLSSRPTRPSRLRT
jgi:hypothetical protein